MTVQGPMRRLSRVLSAMGLIAALAAAAPFVSTGTGEARVGARPADFTLPAVAGGTYRGRFRLRDHLGEDVVAILFWATWCQPCRHELPFYNELYERHKDQGFVAVGISMDGSSTVAQAGPWIRRLGVGFPVVSDLDTSVTNRLNPRRAAPFSIWINHEGRITREREGFSLSERDEIAEGIAALVAARNR